MNKNESIIKLNSRLHDLDEKKRKFDIEEKELEEELIDINANCIKEHDKKEIFFTFFMISLGLVTSTVMGIPRGEFLFPGGLFSNVALSCLSFLGTFTGYQHYSKSFDNILFVKFMREARISQIIFYKEEIENIKSFANKKIHSFGNEDYIEEINVVLDDALYLNNVVSNNVQDQQAVKTLNNHNLKH